MRKNIDALLSYLDSLAGKEYTGQKPGLGRISKMLRLLGNPQDSLNVVHITGTNGKGSTAKLVFSVLDACGCRTGLYTSPHLWDCRERIRVGGRLISRSGLGRQLERMVSADRALFRKLSYFEIMTAAAFLHFRDMKADFTVCEVGLGGRYDATNAVKNPLVTAITSIDYDHMEYMGDSIGDIAREKSGIIKPGVPCVAAIGRRAALKIVSAEARRKGSRLYLLGRDFSFVPRRRCGLVQSFDYRGIDRNYKGLRIRLLGAHQLANASLAAACLELLAGSGLGEKPLRSGLLDAYWPARFEVVRTDPAVIIDGAHNPHGAAALAGALKDFFRGREKPVLVIGVLKGKNHADICSALAPAVSEVVVFKVDSPRALEPAVLAAEWRKHLPSRSVRAAGNLRQAIALAGKGKPLCIAGSLYAVGDALKYYKSAKGN